MNDIIYAKFSSQRKKEYKIITKISNADKGRAVTKEAKYPEGVSHLTQMIENAELLNEQFEGIPLKVLEGHMSGNLLTYDFVSGENLDDKISLLDDDNATSEIIKYFELILSSDKIVPFTVSDDFTVIFGECDGEWKSFEISNIDMIFENIILSNDEYIVIDSEWTFRFPIPLEFILYRCLLHSTRYNMLASECKDRILASLGLTSDDLDLFFEMEQKFQQYVKGDSLDLQEIHERINKHCNRLALYDENMINNDYSVYEDFELTFSGHTIDSVVDLNQIIKPETKLIKVQLNGYNGIIKIISVNALKGGQNIQIQDFETNAELIINNDYYFSAIPELIINNSDYEQISVKYEIIYKNSVIMEPFISSLKSENEYKLKSEDYQHKSEVYSNACNEYQNVIEELKNKCDDYVVQINKCGEDRDIYKSKMEEYQQAYNTLEEEINRIHETFTWKLSEKVNRIIRKA
ncbi:MAG: hypothetical protein J5517_01205 [Eubacterium sp.]|nr:hypothetical protein [Eubacterium sp.]